MCGKPVSDGKQLIGTCGSNVKCYQQNYNTSQLEACAQEEADTRMLLHASDLVAAGYTKLLIRTVDTDVVVLAIAFFQTLSCAELWIAFGTGQHYRYIPVHKLAISLALSSHVHCLYFMPCLAVMLLLNVEKDLLGNIGKMPRGYRGIY